jgi:hypothetical protein
VNRVLDARLCRLGHMCLEAEGKVDVGCRAVAAVSC